MGGTLFLDEIGEMPLALQAKMLRFLECGELQRVGDNETMRVDEPGDSGDAPATGATGDGEDFSAASVLLAAAVAGEWNQGRGGESAAQRGGHAGLHLHRWRLRLDGVPPAPFNGSWQDI